MNTKDYSWLDKCIKQIKDVPLLAMAEYDFRYSDGSGKNGYDIVKLNEIKNKAYAYNKSLIIKKIEEREQALLEELLESLPANKDERLNITSNRYGPPQLVDIKNKGFNQALKAICKLIKERLK